MPPPHSESLRGRRPDDGGGRAPNAGAALYCAGFDRLCFGCRLRRLQLKSRALAASGQTARIRSDAAVARAHTLLSAQKGQPLWAPWPARRRS